MKIIEIEDAGNNTTSSILVTPIEIKREQEHIQVRYTHYCIVNENQIKKLNRDLANGPKGLNITKFDSVTGNPISGQIYFYL